MTRFVELTSETKEVWSLSLLSDESDLLEGRSEIIDFGHVFEVDVSILLSDIAWEKADLYVILEA